MSCSHLKYELLQVLEGWSVKALMNRFDKRSLQMQIDTHKLFLLTSYHARQQASECSAAKLAPLSAKPTSGRSVPADYEAITAEASTLQHKVKALWCACRHLLQWHDQLARQCFACYCCSSGLKCPCGSATVKLPCSYSSTTACPGQA